MDQAAARPVPAPSRAQCQLATSSPEPPAGDGWIYELKNDGHRLAVLSNGRGALRLLSRNGHERTRLFGPAFTGLTDLNRAFMLDGEIAAPDGAGVTHLDDLQAAIMRRQPHRLAYFALDLLYLDGHDLRGCALVERKGLLAALLAAAGCPRLVYVDHVEADGDRLLEAVRATGGEGIVAKRAAATRRTRP
jgi:bifunctional non-homologous end joining protein LigD